MEIYYDRLEKEGHSANYVNAIENMCDSAVSSVRLYGVCLVSILSILGCIKDQH